MKSSRLGNSYNLKVFLSVAEKGSMQAAAHTVGVSQAAVSQTIRQLEDDLGIVLFNRETRPLTMTPFGLALRNRAIDLLDRFSNLKAQVLDAGQGIQPELRIGLVDSFSSTCGTEFIKALVNKTTRLTVRTGLSPHHGERLMRREIDLVVSSDSMIDVEDVMRRRLYSEKFVVITPARLKLRIDSIDDVRNLAKRYPMVRYSRDSQTGIQVNRYLRALEVRQPNWLEVDSADVLTALIADGTGWGITTPMCLVQAGTDAKGVRIHDAFRLGIGRSLFLIARHDEFGVFFEAAFAAAQQVLENHFLPKVQVLHEGLMPLVTIGDESEQE